ncbi:hypothetical protein HY345_04610 [Candidatus Microgenomates bacterium]|nr:hypothetical protein [Candidatus Microgenomates bacterium]
MKRIIKKESSFLRRNLFKIIFLTVFLGICFILGAWYQLHNDIGFTSDISRDFLLFREIDVKKIILIGPRSSVSGLYHGPLWLYLNYPAYLIGQGNPVVVGWYWILLSAVFLVSCFFVARKLFGRNTAFAFLLFMAVYTGFHSSGLFNPHGAYFLMPVFFYVLYSYLKTGLLKYLLLTAVSTGLMIQFQIAIGLPYLILVFLLVLIFSVRHKKYLYPVVFFGVITLMISNFILFEIKHDFLITNGVLRFARDNSFAEKVDLSVILKDRLSFLYAYPEIMHENPYNLSRLVNIIFVLFALLSLRLKKFRGQYLLLMYLYVGYAVLSIINVGPILYFYQFPQFVLVFLFFCSFIDLYPKFIFKAIFTLILVYNLAISIRNASFYGVTNGVKLDSWKILYEADKKIYDSEKQDFGYFVFAPDSLGYTPKYVMLYLDRVYKGKGHYFQKLPITYIVSEPHKLFKDEWWRKHDLQITQEPVFSLTYPNGYKVEKFLLTDEQIKTPFDPSIDPGISFR